MMKLLLTSGGLTNDTLRDAFCELLSKAPSETKIAFIPTAANVFPDHPWVVRDLANLKATGVEIVDVVDLEKITGSEVTKRFHAADVIWMNGGNTYYLLDWIRRCGLASQLEKILSDKVYVGVSAGSMVVGPTVETNSPFFPEEDDHKIDDVRGLGIVPFAIIPHLESPSFPNIREENLRLFAQKVSYPIYGLDDSSALQVINGDVKILSEGKTLAYNNSAQSDRRVAPPAGR